MSGSNGAATLAEEEARVADPYALAAASAEADQKNEERRTDTFRRQNIFQYVIIVLLSATSFIGLFTHKVEVKVVYDHNGTLVDGGTAAALAAPSDANVAAAIAQYVSCLRSVSNDDLRADQCKELVEDIMTQNVAPAHARDDVDAWYQKNNCFFPIASSAIPAALASAPSSLRWQRRRLRRPAHTGERSRTVALVCRTDPGG